MTSGLRTTFLFILFFLTASVVHAQNAGTTHVFPQIVDGVASDGSAFTSRFVIASIGGFPATCNISLFGIGPERLTASPSLLVQPSSWEAISTRGQDVIATGYARLDCSQPVFASLTYSQQSNGKPLGIATVPGAPIAARALIPMVLNGQYRYGIAIANNNDAQLFVSLSFTSNLTPVIRSLQVPARSHYVAFVGDIFSVPADGTGTVEILANGSVGSGNFHNYGAAIRSASLHKRRAGSSLLRRHRVTAAASNNVFQWMCNRVFGKLERRHKDGKLQSGSEDTFRDADSFL